MRAILMLFIMSVVVPLSFFSPFAGLLAFVWTAYFRPQDWAYDPQSQYSLAVAVATLTGYLLFELPRRVPVLKGNILIILLWAQLSLSTVTAFSPPDAWPKYLEFSKILFMAVLMTSMLYNEKRIWWFLFVLLGTIGYLVARANAAIIIKRGDVKIFGIGGTIEDNNDYALLMALTFPIYYYFAAAQEKRWLKIGFYALSAMSLVAGLFTFSRGGLLGLVVAVFGLIFKARRKFTGLGIVLVFGLIFLAVAPSALLDRWKTIQTARTQDESAQQRFRSWYISWRIMQDHPLVGVGTRNITLVYYQYSDPDEKAFVSHNAYLQIATDAGIPALLLFLSILGVSFVRLRKTRRILLIYAPDSPLIKYSHGIEVGLWGYMTSAMFASRQDSEMLFAAIALATSFVIIAREYEQEAKTREFVRKQAQQVVREPRALTPGLDAA